MDLHRNRRERIRELIEDQFGGKYAPFAKAVDVAESTVSRWFMTTNGRKNIGERNARRIEAKLKLEPFSLDRSGDQPVTDDPSKATKEDGYMLELLDIWKRLNDVNRAKLLRFAGELFGDQFPAEDDASQLQRS